MYLRMQFERKSENGTRRQPLTSGGEGLSGGVITVGVICAGAAACIDGGALCAEDRPKRFVNRCRAPRVMSCTGIGERTSMPVLEKVIPFFAAGAALFYFSRWAPVLECFWIHVICRVAGEKARPVNLSEGKGNSADRETGIAFLAVTDRCTGIEAIREARTGY